MQVYTYPEAQNYILYNTFEHPVIALNLYGNSVQDGTPTPDAPIDIVNVGDDGNLSIGIYQKNIINTSNVNYDNWNGVSIKQGEDNYLIFNGTFTERGKNFITNRPYFIEGHKYLFKFESDFQTTGVLLQMPSNSWFFTTMGSESVYTHTAKSGYYPLAISINIAGTVMDNVKARPYVADITYDTSDYVYTPYKYIGAEITSALPLCSVGDVRDELIYNADGTGKVVKRTAKIDSYNGEAIITDYISSTGGLDTNAEVVYVLENPIEIELSAAEITALMKLQTFDGITNIYNYDGAEMKITFLGGNEMQTNIDGFWDSEDGDKKYSAADFVGFFQDFFTNGIVAESTTYLQVLKKSGFEVAVNVGKAYINGCFFKPKTITTLALDVNDGTADRTDLIVIRWDKPLRQIYLAVKKGTTQLTRNELVYELGIAKIAVKASATEITQANISDLRFDNAYCGVVTGVIDTINTTKLFAQYEAEWNNFVSQLGESDHVTINVADEQARADLTAYIAKTDATLSTNAPFKILKGTVTTTTSGATEVKFSKSFASTPTVICAVVEDDYTTSVGYTAFMTLVNPNLFRLFAKKIDSGIPSNWSVTVHWIAFGT